MKNILIGGIAGIIMLGICIFFGLNYATMFIGYVAGLIVGMIK